MTKQYYGANDQEIAKMAASPELRAHAYQTALPTFEQPADEIEPVKAAEQVTRPEPVQTEIGA